MNIAFEGQILVSKPDGTPAWRFPKPNELVFFDQSELGEEFTDKFGVKWKKIHKCDDLNREFIDRSGNVWRSE